MFIEEGKNSNVKEKKNKTEGIKINRKSIHYIHRYFINNINTYLTHTNTIE